MLTLRRVRFIFIISCASAIFSAAFASAPVDSPSAASSSETFGQHWSSIIDNLQASGIKRVGDFDLATFREQAEQIQWKDIAGAPASVLSGSRESAFFLWGKKQVYISRKLPREALASLPQLELHEALGATAYNDHDYALSTALVTLSKLEPAQRLRVERTYSRSIFKKSIMLASEGGTSVSGGGDLATLYVKDQVLKLILAQRQNSIAIEDDFVAQYPSINFEPLQENGLAQIYLKYDYSVATHHESFAVYIPMQIWNKGAKAQDLIIRETARKITEVFPASDSQSKRSFHASSCGPGSPMVHFPATQDRSVAQIQDFRAGLKLGCLNLAFGETGKSILAPALEREQEPKEAGHFYFNCEFHYGTDKITYRLATKSGQSTLSGHQWSLEADDYLSGTAAISNDGQIKWTAISYYPSGGKPAPIKPTMTSDPTYGKTEMIIKGRNLSYECRKTR